jgi:acyl carrier protein
MTVAEKLKNVLVSELNLEGVDPSGIADDTPLFGEGLGLDSLDAVEIVVLVQKHFGFEIKDMEEAKAAFGSVATLAAYIEGRRPCA